jgi:hypothetical protein
VGPLLVAARQALQVPARGFGFIYIDEVSECEHFCISRVVIHVGWFACRPLLSINALGVQDAHSIVVYYDHHFMPKDPRINLL